jgi:hypothetical protein
METLTAQRCRDPLPGPGRRPRDWLDSATVYGVTVLFVITAAWVGDPGNRSTRGRLDHSMKRQAADTPNSTNLEVALDIPRSGSGIG